jgi:hypothetical protein
MASVVQNWTEHYGILTLPDRFSDVERQNDTTLVSLATQLCTTLNVKVLTSSTVKNMAAIRSAGVIVGKVAWFMGWVPERRVRERCLGKASGDTQNRPYVDT